jgi:hypothetical protein
MRDDSDQKAVKNLLEIENKFERVDKNLIALSDKQELQIK